MKKSLLLTILALVLVTVVANARSTRLAPDGNSVGDQKRLETILTTGSWQYVVGTATVTFEVDSYSFYVGGVVAAAASSDVGSEPTCGVWFLAADDRGRVHLHVTALEYPGLPDDSFVTYNEANDTIHLSYKGSTTGLELIHDTRERIACK